ncbi:MAG: glycoside hydrolase family 3 N-terminal domain-containing protein [Candidatus Borkfalkiaceae bacterium]|nr:glycoside hydrolase family 3 N-terminal domain-containing protein [Christensenellaceae bacterium]
MSNKLTSDEKIDLLTGKNSWETNDLGGNLTSVFMSDGPNGLRKRETRTVYDKTTGEKMQEEYTVPATAFPNLSVIANTFSRESAFLMADGIADDCAEHNVDILLAPGVNMKRTPLCGRNFEYFSEDPFLAGELGYEYVTALQKRGVGTSLKHFACNNSERYRLTENSELDERTLMESYLSSFRKVLNAKPYTVMCSYNMVNGVYASENRKLLKGILRDKFGFDGVIVSDWGAVKDRAKSLKATLDLEMPAYSESAEQLKNALNAGFITEEEIDESAERLLTLIKKVEKDRKIRKVTRTKEERKELAEKIAEEGIVLLKNEENVLPLKSGSKIDLFDIGGASQMLSGGGSAKVETDKRPPYLGEALTGEGFEVVSHGQATFRVDLDGEYKIVCLNTTIEDSEARDRLNIKADREKEDLIVRLAEKYSNVIVVIYSGSAIDCSRFVDKVKGIIYVGYAGECGNTAAAKIISGKVNPSGKLSETFPISEEDLPVNINDEYEGSVFYGERFYFGYRWYDKTGVAPLFPFGHGLSYSQFEYSDLNIKKIKEDEYKVSFNVKNVSGVDGKEVSQIYVSDPVCSSDRPVKELKGFAKTFIKAGETKKVTVTLDKNAFAYYNPSVEDFYVENGKYIISVGASSKDLRLTGELEIALPYYTQTTAKDLKLGY